MTFNQSKTIMENPRLSYAQAINDDVPSYYFIILVIGLLSLSCVLGVLNLTLTSIAVVDLKIYQKTGSETEKKYATKLLSLRQRGNFLLITLLICSVLVNCSITVLIDGLLLSIDMFGLSIFLSTTLIIFFGGIIPYVMSSKCGFTIAAQATWITIAFMFMTSIISYPMGRLLDKWLGKNIWESYNRDELRELILDHGDRGCVNRGEVNIITGALALSTKTVKDVMRRLEDSFMIPEDAILDFKTMSEIVSNGYTRVPVYADNQKTNICGLLNVKDLAFIDPNDRIPLKTVYRFYQRNMIVLDADTPLDVILNEFCQGKAHMAFVDTIKPNEYGELSNQIVGLVTLEDVIEEIIQADILDESDVYDEKLHTDHKAKIVDFSLFRSRTGTRKGDGMSPEMKLAVCQHLSSNVSAFSPHLIMREVLQWFLNEDDILVKYTRDPSEPCEKLYEESKPANFAVLILEGQVRVNLIREQLVCVGGPFMFFGESMLIEVNKAIAKVSPSEIIRTTETLPPNLPDYTVELVGSLEYMRITRKQYAIARQASLLKLTSNIDFRCVSGSRLKREDGITYRMNTDDRLEYLRTCTDIRSSRRDRTSSFISFSSLSDKL